MKPFVTVFLKYLLFLLPVGSLLLTGCGETPLKANQIEHAVGSAYTASLSTDGRYSLVSSIHHGLSLWDNQENGVKYQWSHQGSEDNQVLVTAISPDGTHALSADRENFVLWDIASGKAIAFIKIKDSNIRDIALSNGGGHILIGKSNGVVVHITTADGRRLEFLGHQEKINSVDLSDNGRYALTGSNDFVAYFWDTQTGQVIHRFNHPSRVTKVALDHGRRYAFTADSKKQAQIWDIKTGQAVSRLKYIARQNVFSAVRFNQAGTLLATGAPSRKVALWSVASGEKLQGWTVAPKRTPGPKGAVVHSLAFINNNTQLLTESSNGLLETWDIDSDHK